VTPGVLTGPSWTGARRSIRCAVTTRAAGDFNADTVPHDELERRRRAVVDLPWSQLDEVHSADVVVVRYPGDGDGARGDALVTAASGAVLGAWVGDCAPVALVSEGEVIGVAHAGWRGLEAGVLAAIVSTMEAAGARSIEAVVGPCIGPCCNEFGAEDLARMVERFGVSVASRTAWGTPSLDLGAGVAAALAPLGVRVSLDWPCTGCDLRFFSHRIRRERQRHVLALWRER
jgi:copper oxidase (laccase) domain-containing protein